MLGYANLSGWPSHENNRIISGFNEDNFNSCIFIWVLKRVFFYSRSALCFVGKMSSTLNCSPNKEQKFWLGKLLSKYNQNPQDMRLNEQYIPVHRLLGWIMGWDPKSFAGPPSIAGFHMTRTLVWFNDPGSQGGEKKSHFGPRLKSFKNLYCFFPPPNTVCATQSTTSGGLWA